MILRFSSVGNEWHSFWNEWTAEFLIEGETDCRTVANVIQINRGSIEVTETVAALAWLILVEV